jgi:uncharacterized protein with FMN-binding domain
MKRTPFVVTGTMLGLAGVMSFHTTPASLTLGIASTTSGPTTTGPSTTSPPTTTPAPTTSARRPPASSGTPTPTAAPATTVPATTVPPSTSSGTKNATGPAVNYYFGVLSVSVTTEGQKITKVTIASLNDGGNPLSQSIDHQAIPMLEQQAMALQGGNIQGVSGASYTSAGFKMSLQGALSSLGLK